MATSMNISLPESLKQYVKDRCDEGDFSNPSDYVRSLIREDKKRNARAKLQDLLVEGLESGEPISVDSQYLQGKRAQLAGHNRKKPRA